VVSVGWREEEEEEEGRGGNGGSMAVHGDIHRKGEKRKERKEQERDESLSKSQVRWCLVMN
jgi:hypothetical protein